MNLSIYAIRDIKTAQFGTPMFLHNKGHAIRSLADEVNRADDNNMIYKHPEDFELYQVGTYETETGEITPWNVIQICTASELVKPK